MSAAEIRSGAPGQLSREGCPGYLLRRQAASPRGGPPIHARVLAGRGRKGRTEMRQGHHLSRREILNSIRALGSGSLLLPLSALQGERQNTQAPAVIRGALRDGATGRPIAAKIRVTNTWSGEAFLPASEIKTMPGVATTPKRKPSTAFRKKTSRNWPQSRFAKPRNLASVNWPGHQDVP